MNLPQKLSIDTFCCVVKHTPLVSVDLIVRYEGKILLGRRINEPANGYWFTTGGRILKNETIKQAQFRIAKEELGMDTLPLSLKFLGVFEHFHKKSPFPGVSIHYINLGYLLDTRIPPHPPREQHSEYRWFRLEELMKHPDVHEYVKIYFKKDKNGR